MRTSTMEYSARRACRCVSPMPSSLDARCYNCGGFYYPIRPVIYGGNPRESVLYQAVGAALLALLLAVVVIGAILWGGQ